MTFSKLSQHYLQIFDIIKSLSSLNQPNEKATNTFKKEQKKPDAV